MIGGSSPEHSALSEEFAEFVRKHVAAGKVLLTNCTGSAAVAPTGALDGKTATVNNLMYEWSKKTYPKVKWVKGKKWVVDGNVWTAGGAVAGMDMAAQWLSERFGKDVMKQGCRVLEFEPRDVDGKANVVFPGFRVLDEQESRA